MTRVSTRSEAATNDDQLPTAHGGVCTSVATTRVVENYEQSQRRAAGIWLRLSGCSKALLLVSIDDCQLVFALFAIFRPHNTRFGAAW